MMNSFGFLIEDERVIPIMIIGLLISVIIFTFEFYEQKINPKPYAKLVANVLRHTIYGTVVMNVSFFGIITFYPNLSMILVASMSVGLTTKTSKLLGKLDIFISDYKIVTK